MFDTLLDQTDVNAKGYCLEDVRCLTVILCHENLGVTYSGIVCHVPYLHVVWLVIF